MMKYMYNLGTEDDELDVERELGIEDGKLI